jgi:uncharacterized low-complexity protein
MVNTQQTALSSAMTLGICSVELMQSNVSNSVTWFTVTRHRHVSKVTVRDRRYESRCGLAFPQVTS